VVRVAWVVAGRACGLGRGLEEGMAIVKELAAREPSPSRTKAEEKKCIVDV
jgi:hypothetical protein